MKYRLIAFDFDGTLVDSFPIFLLCLNQAAQRHGFKQICETELQACRSISALQLMRRLGIPLWKVPSITREMRHCVLAHTSRITVFPQMLDTLHTLHARGLALAIVSSNTLECAQSVLGPETLKLFEYQLFGAGLFGKRFKLRELLRSSKTPAQHTLYVGDELRDADAARAQGIDFCAVSWGYTMPHVFHNHPRIVLANSIQDLEHLCLSGSGTLIPRTTAPGRPGVSAV